MSLPAKLAVWILIIASVCATGLWLVGGKNLEHSASIEIDGSPQEVFGFLTEPEKLKSWITGLAHVETLQSNTDENGETRRINTDRVISVNGNETRYEDEVIRFQPGETLSVRSSNNDQVITSIFLLEPRESQTYFTYRVIKLNRGIKRMLAPFGNDNTQNQIVGDIRKLKQLVELGN